MRPVRVRIAAAAVLAMAGLLAAPVAHAAPATSCNSPHCYSIGTLDRTDFTGIYGHWHSNNMYLGGSEYENGGHINSEMWLVTAEGGASWVEEGLRNGIDPGDPCGCQAYEVFWADQAPGGTFSRHFIDNDTPDGYDNAYEIQRGAAPNQWDVYYDGNQVGVSAVTGSWTGYEQQIGGEVAANDLGAAHADWFQMTADFRDGAGKWYVSRGGASIPSQVVDSGFTGYWVDSDWVWWVGH
ncbi:hypothetical protein [Kutzneria buriramensis]|uniref:hypothetical protein n=1 Tax=Kutzneria buriramensis TaxID=1045776 RepID=UPI0011C147F5|nr:hypothetical protein [Kutzneria buriramensis]